MGVVLNDCREDFHDCLYLVALVVKLHPPIDRSGALGSPLFSRGDYARVVTAYDPRPVCASVDDRCEAYAALFCHGLGAFRVGLARDSLESREIQDASSGLLVVAARVLSHASSSELHRDLRLDYAGPTYGGQVLEGVLGVASIR